VALRLQQKKDHSEKDKIAWLVDTASRRATRWHGLYELVPASDRDHWYYDDERPKGQKVNFSEAQLRKLARGFVEEPCEGLTLPMMLSLLKDYQDPSVDATSVALIDKLMQGERLPCWMDQLLSLVCKRVGRPMPVNARIKAEEPWLQDPLFVHRDLSDAELKAIWANLRKTIKVPRILIPKTRETKVPGVGEGTPP